jgi:hypothetical protein
LAIWRRLTVSRGAKRPSPLPSTSPAAASLLMLSWWTEVSSSE